MKFCAAFLLSLSFCCVFGTSGVYAADTAVNCRYFTNQFSFHSDNSSSMMDVLLTVEPTDSDFVSISYVIQNSDRVGYQYGVAVASYDKSLVVKYGSSTSGVMPTSSNVNISASKTFGSNGDYLYYWYFSWDRSTDSVSQYTVDSLAPLLVLEKKYNADAVVNYVLPYLVQAIDGNTDGLIPMVVDDVGGDVGSLDLDGLGYLQNVRGTILSITPTNNANYVRRYYRVLWDSTTSTGVSLDMDNNVVQYVVTGQLKDSSGNVLASGHSSYYINSDSDEGKTDYDNHSYDIYLQNSTSAVDTSVIHDLYDSLREKSGLSANELYWGSYPVSFQIHVRPYHADGHTITYGGWSVVDFSNVNLFSGDGNAAVVNGVNEGTIVNDDGSVDSVDSTYDFDFTAGGGDNADEATNNSNPNGGSSGLSIGSVDVGLDSIQSLSDSASSFLSFIGNVPKIIAKIFSFLPSWCLTLVTTGFALVILLIVYKLIRG
jgi:hypothetical protein